MLHYRHRLKTTHLLANAAHQRVAVSVSNATLATHDALCILLLLRVSIPACFSKTLTYIEVRGSMHRRVGQPQENKIKYHAVQLAVAYT